MNVLHINSYYSTSGFYKKLYDKQIEQGLNIDVFVPVPKGFASTKDYGNYTLLSPNHNKYNRFVFRIKQNKILKDVQRKYNLANYTHIHAHSLFTNGYVAYKLYQKYGTPYIVAVRNTDLNVFFKKVPFLRKLGIKILRNASKIIFISEPYKDQVLKRYVPKKIEHKIEEKTSIVPNGVEDFWLNNKYSQSSVNGKHKIKLLQVGEISKGKNQTTSVKAVQKLRDQGYDVTLTVVGKVKDEKILNRILEFDFVTHIDHTSKENLIGIYRSHDIFIMPSHTETFGLVYVEAMTQGLPVIYTKNQGFDGHFKDGEVGKKVSSDDYEEIADKCKEILTKYNHISENCLVNSEKFRWDIITIEYIKSYKQILK